jgi:hypothetical protein
LPEEQLEEIYRGDVMRHFYSVDEIATFKRRWRGPAA